jgi:hypothetical protein
MSDQLYEFYIGTKHLRARPETRKVDGAKGYEVKYPDGYKSWSPKETFEGAYRQDGEWDFGMALYMLRRGHRLRRRGWNGKGMFVYLVAGSTFAVNRPPLDQLYDHGTEVTYRPHLDMKATDGTLGVWVPSQTDILAEDWELA